MQYFLVKYRFYILIALGCLMQAGFLSLILLGNLTDHAVEYIWFYLFLFGLYGLATWLVLRKPYYVKPKKEAPQEAGNLTVRNQTTSSPLKNSLLIIIFFAVTFRLSLVLVAPTLSTDQFRYTWEGRLVTQGISPYRYAPDDPALTPYHSPIWPLVQQRETASPYPPLSQLIGAVEYLLLQDNILGPKIAAALFDILNCLALLWLLGLYGLDRRKVILYAWCPLPAIEFGQSGHNDAPMLLLLLVAIGLARQKRPYWSALALGLACLAKFTPLFALPVFLVCWAGVSLGKTGPRWQGLLKAYWRNWRYPALTLAVIVAGYVPFVALGQGAIGSIFEYTGSWRDNESLLYGWAADFWGNSVAKGVSLLIFGTGLLLLSFWPRLVYRLSLPRRVTLVLGLTLLVASTIHVWYLSWLLVLLPLVWGESEWKLWDGAWLIFAITAELPYLTYFYNGDTPLFQWIRPLEFWPLNGLIIYNLWEIWRNHRAKRLVTGELPSSVLE
ncbi:MAG: DUF2029 domain-containing protein [Chloroflexi bacterium]|nr:DUF2029 domain-containing protein [Chloroflexota bacterium]OJV92750.1 MAG: hypothetical protein BGO39_29740 [Chloroflexi bacterium 54-19]